jgi:hypothetical protein
VIQLQPKSSTKAIELLNISIFSIILKDFIRTNLELQNVYRSPDIVTEIKVRRLEWLGHIIRMDGARMAKKMFVTKPEGRRDIGRPKLRWLDDVEDDIKALGIRRWRIKAQDRNEWTAINREAKVKLKGP